MTHRYSLNLCLCKNDGDILVFLSIFRSKLRLKFLSGSKVVPNIAIINLSLNPDVVNIRYFKLKYSHDLKFYRSTTCECKDRGMSKSENKKIKIGRRL